MGYFIIDQRASGDGVIEKDTLSCPHCQGVIFKKDIMLGGWKCSKCRKYLCKACSTVYQKNPLTEQVQECDPWQEKLERDVRNATRVAIEGGWL